MLVIVLPFLPRSGMAIFPFIVIRDKINKQNKVLLNHERIHLRQQLELMIVPFYTWYLFNYLYALIKTKDHDKAYRNIIFEQEAYKNEDDLKYLTNRKPFSFWKYI